MSDKAAKLLSEADSAMVAEEVAKAMDHLKWSVWASGPERLNKQDQESVVKESVDSIADGILRKMFPDLYDEIDKQHTTDQADDSHQQHTTDQADDSECK